MKTILVQFLIISTQTIPLLSAEKPEIVLPENDVQWYALMMAGKKCGHCVLKAHTVDGIVTSTEESMMVINRGNGAKLTVNSTLTCKESVDGKPLSFTYKQEALMMNKEIKATIDKDGNLVRTITTKAGETTKTSKWPENTLLLWGASRLNQLKGLKTNTEYKYKYYDVSNSTSLEHSVKIGSKEQIDLFGRVVDAVKIKVSLSSSPGSGALDITLYVSPDTKKTLKSITPFMGSTAEQIACDKQVALGENNPANMTERSLMASPVRIRSPRRTKNLKIIIESKKKDHKLTFPSTDNQKPSTEKDGKTVLEISYSRPSKGEPFPYKGDDKQALEALKPNEHVESDHPEIIALAKKAVGNYKDTVRAAQAIEKFVSRYINSKNMQVGYASALETARSRQGDCSEHAVLTAALCRATGIPAEVCFGLVYADSFHTGRQVFVPHAWNRVYIGGKWCVFDAALYNSMINGNGGDASRILMAHGGGSSDKFFELFIMFDKFKVVDITEE